MKVFKQEIDKNKENVKYPPFTQILSVMALYLIKKETIAAEEFLTKCFSEYIVENMLKFINFS